MRFFLVQLENELVGRLKRNAAERLVTTNLLPERRRSTLKGEGGTSADPPPPVSRLPSPSPTGAAPPDYCSPGTARPPLMHYYLLRVPMLKFALRMASDVALAVYVTFEEGEPLLDPILIDRIAF